MSGYALDLVCLFVCVEVLRPSQPNWVMSSAVSLLNHTFTGHAIGVPRYFLYIVATTKKRLC